MRVIRTGFAVSHIHFMFMYALEIKYYVLYYVCKHDIYVSSVLFSLLKVEFKRKLPIFSHTQNVIGSILSTVRINLRIDSIYNKNLFRLK